MAGRESFDSMLWLRTSLTFLAIAASVLVAPIQTWGSVPVSPLPDCPLGDDAQGTAKSISLSGVVLTSDAVLKEHAIASEDKDEDPRGESALAESRIPFLLCWCFRKAPDRPLIALRSVLTLYHLRC